MFRSFYNFVCPLQTAGEAQERIDPRLVQVPREGSPHQVRRRSGVQRHPQGLRSAAQHCGRQHSGVSEVRQDTRSKSYMGQRIWDTS